MAENEKIVETTASGLKKKYYSKRRLNLGIEKTKKPWQKVVEFITKILTILLIVGFSTFAISVIVSKFKKTVPIYCGYSIMRVATGSMTNSGFDIGDLIVTQSVDPKTLKVGDNIAFYVDYNNSAKFSRFSAKEIEGAPKTKYVFNIESVIGLHNKTIEDASKRDCKIVFHEIKHVYEDKNGERWFRTKGSTNSNEDSWYINENLVIGKHTTSHFARFVAKILSIVFYNPTALIFTALLPFILIVAFVGFGFVKDIALLFLELDVIEEKRKITDPICVKNHVGYYMENKSKYKVLAQAHQDEIPLYLSLLWKDGSAPNSIRKYYLRKRLLLSKNEKMLELNRKCKLMFERGEDEKEIATYYLNEKEQITKNYDERKARLEHLRKTYAQKEKESANSNKKKK